MKSTPLYKRAWGIRPQIILLAAVPLTFLLLLLVISGVLQRMFEQTEGSSRTATAVVAQALRVQQIVGGATGALGAYYKSHNASVLAPYDEMHRTLPPAIAELRRLEAVEGGQSKAVEHYIASTLTISKVMDDLAQALKAHQDQKVRSLVAAPATVRAGDEWKATLQVLQQEQQLRSLAGLVTLRAFLQLLGRWALILSAIGVVLTLVVAARLIRHVSAPMRDAVVALASGTSQLLAGTERQTSGVAEQAAAVTQTTNTVEEIAHTAEQANERAKWVADSARRASQDGTAGREAVDAAIAAMSQAMERSKSSSERILSLASQANAIGEMNALVTEIADQTNLLALNAAIQAAGAGEARAGFTIIARQVKALAQESKEVTARVREILAKITQAADDAVVSVDDGNRSVEDANVAVQRAGEVIRSLANTIAEASDAAVQISASANQQAIGMSQIQHAMRDIAQSTNTNLASTQQAEKVARELDTVSLHLRVLLRGAAA